MAESRNYVLSHTELAEVLVKHLGIHEGLWGISFEFGFAAANVPTAPDGLTVMPAAIATVGKVGIQRFDKRNNLTVDAALVNPSITSHSAKSARRRL